MEFPGEIMYGVGALILLGALFWGTYQYKTRNRRNDRVTEEATRQQYDDPAHYPEKREELKQRVEPS